MAYLGLFALMVVAHMLADYPLQGDFLSKAKNRASPIPGVPWWQALGAHCIIQAGAVWLITGSAWLGLAEFVVHAATDDAKCMGRIDFNTDQLIHVSCKAVWAVLAISVLA